MIEWVNIKYLAQCLAGSTYLLILLLLLLPVSCSLSFWNLQLNKCRLPCSQPEGKITQGSLCGSHQHHWHAYIILKLLLNSSLGRDTLPFSAGYPRPHPHSTSRYSLHLSPVIIHIVGSSAVFFLYLLVLEPRVLLCPVDSQGILH